MPEPPAPPAVPPGHAPPFQPEKNGPWIRIDPSGVLRIYFNGFWLNISPLAPAQMYPGFTPGSGPFRPFAGGPVYRVPPGGGLQIYTPGVGWGNGPYANPSTSVPNPKPPIAYSGPVPSKVGPGLMAIVAVYDSLNGLYDAALAVREITKDITKAIEAGRRLSVTQARVNDWVNWLKNNPLGQQLADVMACILNSVIAIQGEIDRILAIAHEDRTWAHYNHLALLQMALTHMQIHVAFFRELRRDFILNPGDVPGSGGYDLPNYDQVNSITCTPIPLEQAPIPLPITVHPPEFIVPDAPPVGNGPIFPGIARPPTLPLYGVSAEQDLISVTLNDLLYRESLRERQGTILS